VLNTAPVAMGATAAAVIASGSSETFNIQTASGDHAFTLYGQTGDTVASQMTELNNQLSGMGISASLTAGNILQLQSGNAFSASVTNAGLAATGTKEDNTGLYNVQYAPTAADDFTITVGSAVATIGSLSATGQAGVNQINKALETAGITGVQAVLSNVSAGDISIQGSSSFTIAAAGAGFTTAPGSVNTPSGSGGDPTSAINAITAAVQTLGTVQGIVGAGENKLNYAINLAQSQITSFSSAQSQIRDANVAAEAATLTQSQVLQQSSIAAMAQANAEPQAVLALLQKL